MKQNEKIKKIRQYRGLTQKDVAQKMGVSVQSYSQYETGKRNPTRKTLDKIAAAIGCDASDIADDLISGNAQNTLVTDDTTMFGIDMLFRGLNTNGQRKAIEYITLLLNAPEYSNMVKLSPDKTMRTLFIKHLIASYFPEFQNDNIDETNPLKEGE
jgi:transcriptional regulator with XRE-family HTH domain